MLAPPITLFFSPISSSTTTTTTSTASSLIDTKATRLALKAALLVSAGSSMNQRKRPLSQTANTKKSISKSTSKDSQAARSSTTNHSQPPLKKQKQDAETDRRVKLPLRSNNNNTLTRSRVDGSLELAGTTRQQGKVAVQPLSNGTIAEDVDVGETQKKIVKKLRLDIAEAPNKPPAGIVSEAETLVNGRTRKDDGKRSLRSHDGGSRSKSELAQYFPNFDEIINPEAREKEFLNPKTRLFITDEPPKTSGSAQFILPTPTRTRALSFSVNSPRQQSRPLPPAPPLDWTFEKIELPSVNKADEDPLSDAYYEVAHRRAERQEKQLRNIERERAQHEKFQLERLQEGLLGPDWLKIMGISGVTEGDRKKWDDAREYFLKEVRCLLDKFARWKEEERRRKLVEVRKRKEAEEEEDDDDEEEDEDEEDEDEISAESSPDAAAHQLQLETLSASVGGKDKASRVGRPRKRALDTTSLPATPSKRRPKANSVTMIPEIPTGPFLSFFAKPHQRAAALDKNRRTGRTRWAFGHPVPDMAEKAFTLPREMVSEEGRKASARLRRGMRRGRE